ncbi:LTA synthase family protein [Clostridium aminobutyricum]|uniref:Sulfatase-like hydrolase/transferase n=1 Tax=Clostridium aminobutyricum TaxID=33953 RepID=A0A939D673_CLOAM|nr:LTA synthase family protein [Clostridium aminobutyricum]MBN7772159.1 sulfatase-like hydrolase/transferase [Clostridium aminobutyricum]
MNKYTDKIKDIFLEYKGVYGLLGCVTIGFVLAKFIVFYNLMSIHDNFIMVCLISMVITYFLFASFKNKLIPAVLYAIFSVLMFADVTYCSFFNKYLSVALAGSAGMLGDITASIKQVMRPINFFMFADSVLIFATIITASTRIKDRSAEAKADVVLTDDDFIIPQENKYTVIEKNVEIVSRQEYQTSTSVMNRRERLKARRKRESLQWVQVHRNQVLPLALIFILIASSSVVPFVKSVTNQEFYTYHMKDLITGGANQKHVIAFTDHYQDEKEGPLFGVGEGKNLVVVQMESFQNFLLGLEYNGQEVTPVLNSLVKDHSIYFDHYYQQVGTGNTSDAEYATNNSMMGSIQAFTYQLYENNYFRGLPVLLKEKGYETAVLHAHENRDFWNRDDIYGNMGFDHYYGGLKGNKDGCFEMTEWMGWGLTDSEFYPQAVDYIKELQEPFYSFVITLSNHHPYEMLDKYKFIDLLPEDEGTLVGNYLTSAAYTDYALGKLIDEMKKAGLYENTVFAFYGDHMGLPKAEETDKIMTRILGHDYDWDDRMNIPLIIHIPDSDDSITQVCHNAGGQIDFLPTIAYLMGFDKLDTIYLGHNLINYRDGLIAEHAYLVYGSFFSNQIGFEMSRDGVFENSRAWDLKTRKSVEVNDYYDDYVRSMEISDTSVYILQNDILRKVYQDGMDIDKAFN